jgi:hypothetical protein
MPASRIRQDSGLLVATALAVALSAGPIAASASDGKTSAWKVVQAQPRKDPPKAALPSAKKTPAATSDICDPATRNLDAISAALNQAAPQVQKTCATPASPARIRLVGADNRAIVVRPLVGDIDAVLSSGKQVIDVSMNSRRRAELLLLPATGEFELAIAADSATATFEINVVRLKKVQSERTAVVQQKGLLRPSAERAGQAYTAPPSWVPWVFRDLGFDLIGNSTDDAPVDPRAIMAFQAGEKFEITGTLKPEEVAVLADQAALQIDIAAQEAVKTARRLSQNSPLVTFPDPPAEEPAPAPPSPAKKQAGKKATEPQDEPSGPPETPSGLKSMKGAFDNGKFFGIGVLRSGSQFEGEWLDGPTAGDSARPALGLLFSANDCSAAIKTFGMGVSNETVADEAAIIATSIGVMRKKNRKLFSGDLNQAGEQTQDCVSDPAR